MSSTGIRQPGMMSLISSVSDSVRSGRWSDYSGLNILAGKQEEARYFMSVRDRLVFMSMRFGQ